MKDRNVGGPVLGEGRREIARCGSYTTSQTSSTGPVSHSFLRKAAAS